MKLRDKILFLIIISILLVSLIITYVFVDRTSEAFQYETEEKLEYLTAKYASEFDAELINIEHIVDDLELYVLSTINLEDSQSTYMDSYTDEIAPMIKEIADKGHQTKSAYVYFDPSIDGKAHDVWFADLNHDGLVTRQSEFDFEFYKNSTQDKAWYFSPKATGKSYWSLPYQGNTKSDKDIVYISYTKPIYYNDQFIGVVGSDFHYEYIKETIENIQVYETGYALLMDESQNIMIHPNYDNIINFSVINEGAYRYMADSFSLKDRDVLYYEWVDSKEKILVFEKLKNNWIFAIAIYEEDAFKWISELSTIISVILLIALFICIIIISQITNFMTKPLLTLQAIVKQIGEGDYNQKIPEAYQLRKDEIGRLSSSIELMRLKQKETFEELLNYNSTLELKVLERTESLSSINETLELSLDENKRRRHELSDLNLQLEEAMLHMTETQLQLIDSEKRASLNALITRLAHDFNTPVGNMIMLLSYLEAKENDLEKIYNDDLLKKEDLENFFSVYNETYSLIGENIATINHIVGRFKALNPSNVTTLNSTIYLKDFVSVVIESLDYTWEGIDYEIQCENIEISTDSAKLSQILIHLVENAYLHAFKNQDQGLISIHLWMEDQLMISIKDNGLGMSETQMADIFKPAYTDALNTGFTGLGLSIVYNLVHNHFGGEIECESDLGVGTNFIVKINLV